MASTESMLPPGENVAQTMRDVMAKLGAIEQLNEPSDSAFVEPVLYSVPHGRNIEDLTEAYREAAEYLTPLRRKGTAALTDLASLINWANRFKGESSALFANPNMSAPSLSCIADYHAAGAATFDPASGDHTARHCHHRAKYAFPLSEDWKAWMKISGEGLDRNEMGEFIEEQAHAILDPTPAVISGDLDKTAEPWEARMIETAKRIEGRFGQLSNLLNMSREFTVHESSNLTASTNRDTGESEIQFVNEHKDKEGQKLKIPNLFIIAIPVFLNGSPYRMAVRFRYRKTGPNIKFVMTVYNKEKVFEAAFEESVQRAAEETALPLFMGNPES